jgi:hypothetical protein
MDTALAAALLGGIFALIAAVLSAITTMRVNSIRRGLQVGIAIPRTEAYRNLRDLTRRSSSDHPPSQEERDRLEEDLFDWYFTGGQGIFLSDRSRDIVQGLQAQLRDVNISWDAVRHTYSTLRMSLKDDIGVFTGRTASVGRGYSLSEVDLTSLSGLVPKSRGGD